MIYSLKALNDSLIVKPIDLKEKNSSTIIIPDLGKERPEIVEVLDVGPGKWEFGVFVNTTICVGDILIVPKIGTIKFDLDGEEYYNVKEREVLAIIKKVNEK